jgi:hypothetical protein
LLEKLLFLRSAGATENTIPMRKAAEAGDDLVMMVRCRHEGRLVRVFR